MGGRAEGLACADPGARTPSALAEISEGLGEMFEGDSADMCAGKFPHTSMGGRAVGVACADLGARNPIGTSGNSSC